MRYVRIKVKRDTNTVINRAVPTWEVPVLEFVFGEDGNIEVTENFEQVTDRDYPEAGDEFQRMVQRYGSDQKSGVPHVASVYGNAGVGIRALKKAIAEAKAEDEVAEKEAKPVPAAKRTRRQVTADSLLN